MLRTLLLAAMGWMSLGLGVAVAQDNPPTPISLETVFDVQEQGRYQTNAITEVTWSHDGERLFVGHNNGLIEMVNPDDLTEDPVLITDHAPGSPITMLRVSPDDKFLASSSMDGTVRLWDMEARETIGVLRHRAPVWAVDFYPEGDVIVTGDQNGLIQLWDMGGMTVIRAFSTQHDLSITQLQFNADGTHLYSTSIDRTARLWDVESGEEIAQFADHYQAVSSMALSHDGAWLVTGGGDSSVIVYDLATETRFDIMNSHQGGVSSLAFSLDDSLLVSAGQDSVLRLWDITMGEVVMGLQGHQAWVQSVAFSADGARLASGDSSGRLIVWGLAD